MARRAALYARASQARCIALARAVRAYTPHGGSFNYQPGRLAALALHGGRDGCLPRRPTCFCSRAPSSRGGSTAQVGANAVFDAIVVNGLQRRRVRRGRRATPTRPNLLYVGELRAAKGVDTLLEALARPAQDSAELPRVVLVGSGPDKDILIALAHRARRRPSPVLSRPDAGARGVQLGRILVGALARRVPCPMSCWRRRRRAFR